MNTDHDEPSFGTSRFYALGDDGICQECNQVMNELHLLGNDIAATFSHISPHPYPL